MELTFLWQTMRRWAWLLLLGAAAGAAGGYLVLSTLTPWPRYRATATILIDYALPNSEAALALRDTYVALATREPVTRLVLETVQLGLTPDELSDLIAAQGVGRTQLLEIGVTYGDRQQAAVIANEVARQLQQVAFSEETHQVRIISTAGIPARPQWGGYVALVVAGLTGFSSAAGIVLLTVIAADRLYTAQEVEERLGIPVLGTVEWKDRRPGGLRGLQAAIFGPAEVLPEQSGMPLKSETYQWLCFGIDHAAAGTPAKLMVTGPRLVAEQMTLAMGLANSWAEQERRVVLVNAGSRPPVISDWYGFTEHGRSHALARIKLEERLTMSSGEMTADSTEPPAALLQSATDIPLPGGGAAPQNVVLDKLAQESDQLLINGPAVLSAPQAAVMGQYADAILLVLVAGKSQTGEAREALRLLRMAGGHVLGAALLVG